MSEFEMKTLYALPINTIQALDSIGTFQGYASTPDKDKAKDVILKGSFAETLAYWKKEHKGFPNIYDEHNRHHFIGTCKSLYEDDKGLYVEGLLFVNDIPKAKEVYQSLKAGLKSCLSIGFYVKKSFLENGVRYIQKVDLVEISIVSNPCNSRAQIHEFKRDHDPTNHKDPDPTNRNVLTEIRKLTARLKA